MAFCFHTFPPSTTLNFKRLNLLVCVFIPFLPPTPTGQESAPLWWVMWMENTTTSQRSMFFSGGCLSLMLPTSQAAWSSVYQQYQMTSSQSQSPLYPRSYTAMSRWVTWHTRWITWHGSKVTWPLHKWLVVSRLHQNSSKTGCFIEGEEIEWSKKSIDRNLLITVTYQAVSFSLHFWCSVYFSKGSAH